MRNAYIIPSLLTAACAVAVGAAVRRVSRRTRERPASGDIWDQAFIDDLFREHEHERREHEHGCRGRHRDDRSTDGDRDEVHDDFVQALTEDLIGEFVEDLLDASEDDDSPGTSGDDDFLGTPEEAFADFIEPDPTERPDTDADTPRSSDRPTPLLPVHRTRDYLVGLVAGVTPITRVRTGSPGGGGGVDVFDFADGSAIVVMPGAPDAAIPIDAALAMGRPVRLLGASELGNGYALTFRVDTTVAYALADRVYVRPPA